MIYFLSVTNSGLHDAETCGHVVEEYPRQHLDPVKETVHTGRQKAVDISHCNSALQLLRLVFMPR